MTISKAFFVMKCKGKRIAGFEMHERRNCVMENPKRAALDWAYKDRSRLGHLRQNAGVAFVNGAESFGPAHRRRLEFVV